MQYKCEVCNDSGSLNKFGPYYDCTACDAAEQRVALEKWCSETQQRGPSFDDCWAIHQRALAMAPKQEAPAGVVAWMSKDGRETTSAASKKFMETCGYGVWHEVAPRYVIPLVAAPAAANGAPELPAPATLIVESDLGHRAYSADQMRAYGQACAAASNSGSKNSSSCALTPEQIDAVWNGMNGDKEWLRTFGYQQFASAILAAAGPDAALTELHVSKIARYLSDFTSSQCNVDKDDAWKIYGDDEIERVRAALAHAGVALSGAKGN